MRTLAKAVWKSGVGVWIDVVKLCPGDEIRPMVRTTYVENGDTDSASSASEPASRLPPLSLAEFDPFFPFPHIVRVVSLLSLCVRLLVVRSVRRVHKVVVFLCDEYCQSPNCCIEMMEAVQHPEKVTICIIKNNINPKVTRAHTQRHAERRRRT